MNNEEYVQVYSANGRLEADMIRLMLEAAGLSVISRQESAGAVYGFTVGRMGEVVLLVPKSQAAEATRLLQEMEEGKLESETPPETPPENSGGDEEI